MEHNMTVFDPDEDACSCRIKKSILHKMKVLTETCVTPQHSGYYTGTDRNRNASEPSIWCCPDSEDFFLCMDSRCVKN